LGKVVLGGHARVPNNRFGSMLAHAARTSANIYLKYRGVAIY